MIKTMRVKAINQAICVALIAVPLSACGNTAIDNVKKTQFGDDATLTVGQALDHRKECDSVHWTSDKDERSRTVVTYECMLKNVDTYVANRLAVANDDLKKRMVPTDNSARNGEIERKKDALANAQAGGNQLSIQIAQSELDEAQKEYADLNKQQAQHADALQKMIDENTAAVDNNPLKKVDEKFQWVVADDGSVVLTGYSLTASFKSGLTRQMHVEMGQVFRAIAQDQQEDVSGYLKAIQVSAPAGMNQM